MQSRFSPHTYRPMPDEARFYTFWQEACYTELELHFREFARRKRLEAHFHADLATNSWFDDDALVNINADAWIQGPAFKPKQNIHPDDFHIDALDPRITQWPSITLLMRQISDYLHVRNQLLSPQHLNQPMNFILLDVIQMLKKLAQIPDPHRVKLELGKIKSYLKALEREALTSVGSDRMFLSDSQITIQHVLNAELESHLNTQDLLSHTETLKKNLEQLVMHHHTFLHFALHPHLVNPNPYLEAFEHPTPNKMSIAYPTSYIKACAEKWACSESLLSADTKTKEMYITALQDLDKLLHVKGILDEIHIMLSQAGEVFTIYQFRTQIETLLIDLSGFVLDANLHIEALQLANTEIYQHMIQAKQDSSLWSRWMGDETATIDAVITNHDNLDRFKLEDPKSVLNDVSQAISAVRQHLNNKNNVAHEIALIDAHRTALLAIMTEVHQWQSRHYLQKGLPEPVKPLLISDKLDNCDSPAPPPVAPIYPVNIHNFFQPVNRPLLSNGCYGDNCQQSANNMAQALPFALLIALPLMILGLCLLYRHFNQRRHTESEPRHPEQSEGSPSIST